ncbi:MAG: DUF87 domain-containing protein [Candidatus Omnitrophica bacterium]|nr:DUF87 domain-containing protein [Candidatus Omnitrophota bacterium]
MKNTYEKINKFDPNNPKADLFSYADKAVARIEHIADEAGISEIKAVQNAIKIIRGFPRNYELVNREVEKVEALVMSNKNNNSKNKAISEVFKNGTIAIGRIEEAGTEVKLSVPDFSGNVLVYGQYGMGKTNLNQVIIPQLVSQGIHVDVFDVTNDYRDLILVPECKDGLVLNHETDRLNPLDIIGNLDEDLQFFWEITSQDFNIHNETKEMLFNYSIELYEKFGVREGGDPPTLFDLRDRLKEEREKKGTSPATKRKIDTAISKLNYILSTFGKMVNCKRSYSLDVLDSYPVVIREVSALSEDKRSWYIKLNLRRFYNKGLAGKERHKVKRVIVIDEAKAIFGKSVIGEASNFIKDTFTKSRSKGDVYVLSDQFATELAPFTRAANCQLCFQHTVPSEIREIATSIAGDESTRAEIPKLGKYKVLMKITDFPYPFPVVIYKSKVERHIDDAENARLMKDKHARLNNEPQKTNDKKRARVIVRELVRESSKALIKVISQVKGNVLDDLERFLKYIKDNPNSKVTEIYQALGLSGRKGNSLKTKAKENQLIIEKSEHREGKGRPSIELELTDKGKEYLNEKQ